MIACPLVEPATGGLWSVVQGGQLWSWPCLDDLVKQPRSYPAGQRGAHANGQRFAGTGIHNRERAQATATAHGVTLEVQAPAFVGHGADRRWLPSAGCDPLAFALWDR